MKCPECGKDMIGPTTIDIKTEGWTCSNHEDYEIQVTRRYNHPSKKP